jgi:hypothetical protein
MLNQKQQKFPIPTSFESYFPQSSKAPDAEEDELW